MATNNPNPFGAFAEGIAGGINAIPVAKARRLANEKAALDLQDLRDARALQGDLAKFDISGLSEEQAIPVGTRLPGPPEPGKGPPVAVDQQAASGQQLQKLIQRAYASGDKDTIENAQRIAVMGLTPVIQRAVSADMPMTERARLLNQATEVMGVGSPFSTDAKGNMRVAGQTIGPNDMPLLTYYATALLKDPTQASAFLGESLRAGRGEQRDERQLSALEEHYQTLKTHYENADSIALLKELNDFAALSGTKGLKPADVDRLSKAVDRSLDKSFKALTAYDPLQVGSMAKAIAFYNDAAHGNISDDDAARLGAQLYWTINAEMGALPDDVLEELQGELGKDFKPDPPMLQPVTSEGQPTGTYAATFSNGEQVIIPSTIVQPYVDWKKSQEASRAKLQNKGRAQQPAATPQGYGDYPREQFPNPNKSYIDNPWMPNQ